MTPSAWPPEAIRPVPVAFRPCVLRRPGSVSPQPRPVLSGSSTPEEICPSCGAAFLPDAIFCRHCGHKREELETYGVSPEACEYVYNDVYSGGLSGSVTPTSGGVYLPDYKAISGVATPTTGASSWKVYPDPQPVYSGMSGSLTPSVPYEAPWTGTARAVVTPVQMLSSHVVPAVTGPTGPTGPVVKGPVITAPAAPAAVAPAPVVMAPMVTTPAEPTTWSPLRAPGAPGSGEVPRASYAPPIQGAVARSVSPCPRRPGAWTQVEKQVEEPQVPPSLTAGLPDPTSIERQKNAYAKGLEDQLRHGTDVLAQQLKQQSEYLFAMGDQRKRQFALQVDQEIKQREMELAQQHNEQLLLLQQAAQQQKSALEHQANALLLEYNQKKAQEDLAYQQYQFQKKQYETQLLYNEEMKELQVQQSAAQQQVAHQRACIAQQAVQAKQQAQQAEASARQVRSSHPGVAAIPSAPTMYPTQTFAQ